MNLDMIIQSTGNSCTRDQLISIEKHIVRVGFCLPQSRPGFGVASHDGDDCGLGVVLLEEDGERGGQPPL